ncbi:hypothetical protein SDJN02_12422, partial [Cucurbita argyrosperma subsp. argyrosperma]
MKSEEEVNNTPIKPDRQGHWFEVDNPILNIRRNTPTGDCNTSGRDNKTMKQEGGYVGAGDPLREGEFQLVH